MLTFLRINIRKCLVAGVVLAVIMPAVPALADTTSTTTTTADSSITQVADTGTATVSQDPVDTSTTDPSLPATPVVTNPIIDTPAPSDTANSPDPAATLPTADSNAPNASSNSDTSATINNNQDSNTTTGNATVENNQQGGNATTGDALNQTTLVNLLNSITGLNNGQLSTFITNVTGDVNGNLSIDPSLLGSLTGTSASQTGSGGDVNLNNNSSSQINNNIYLDSNTGDATVADNGTGGNATTGNASNNLNLINLINSAISSGQSFLGIINIFGNLNGNIYLPTGFLNNLLASNQNSPNTSSNGSLDINNANTSTITNNITMLANSGNATVADNGTGGNATTGNALNNLNLFNLTNQQIIGNNDLLVFVNVLGTWVGFIVNAPQGATTAEFGSGLGQTVVGSGGGDVQLNNTTNNQINNTVYMTATTGNAYVLDNGQGGNATTGNATNSANILNIINSSLHLNGWFGMLFINVFGTWTGNLAEAPVVVVPVDPITPSTPYGSSNTSPAPANNNQPTFYLASSVTSSDPTPPQTDGHVLGAATDPTNIGEPGAVKTFNWILPISGFCIALVLYLCTSRVLAYRKNH